MHDEDIIELFHQRNQDGIIALDEKYGTQLRQMGYNILKSWEDTQECVNDTYLGAWNAMPPARPNPLRAYICRILRNLSLKCYYRRGYGKRSSYETAMEELGETLVSADSVERQVERQELVKTIEGFLETLSAESAAIFLRRYWFGDSYRDISQRTGLSEKAVSVRLSRTRQKLRAHLTKEGLL